jgi:class 3 adenylate cyclase
MASVKRSAELESVARRWLDARVDQDSETAANLFYPAEFLRYVGTDAHEWWEGSRIPDAYPQHMAKYPPTRVVVDSGEAFETGEVGWAALQGSISVADHEPVPLRWTFVFVLDGGVWRIVQVHSSVPFPNPVLVGVELTRTLEELLSQLGSDYERVVARSIQYGTVTVMFTDIEDSTRLAAQVGDEAWADLILWHDREIRTAVQRGDGSVVKTLGDGAMAVFDSTRAAAQTALEIQRAFQQRTEASPVRIAIGLHVGDAVRAEGDYLGMTVNKAARIASAADGGEIVVSDAVRALLSDDHGFTFGPPRRVELKGIDGVHDIFTVSG